MPRDRANIQTAIWSSQDWRALHPMAQWLYELLLTHPSLSYAGVCDWLPKRLTFMATGLTVEQVMAAGAELQEARFIYVDPETDEAVLRSFLRHDGLMKNPKVAVSMANDFGSVASPRIQKLIVHELQRLAREFPEWAAFKQDRVKSLLKLEGASLEDLSGHDHPQGFPQGLGEGYPQAFPLPTATATATATRPSSEGLGGSGGELALATPTEDAPPPEKPKIPLPASWEPTKEHRAYAQTKHLNIDEEAFAFKSHAETVDRRVVSWNGAFATWLRKSAEKAIPKQSASLRNVEAGRRLHERVTQHPPTMKEIF